MCNGRTPLMEWNANLQVLGSNKNKVEKINKLVLIAA